MLVERTGEVVTREEVRQRLWPEDTFVEFDNSLGVTIRKVRDSLGDDAEAPRSVETVRVADTVLSRLLSVSGCWSRVRRGDTGRSVSLAALFLRRHDLRSLAAQRGFEIVAEYTDRISGAKATRPGRHPQALAVTQASRVQLSLHCSICLFDGECDCCMNVVMPFAYDHGLGKSNIHSDVATFVDATARTIQVTQADRDRVDFSRKSPQGEVHAPRDVILQFRGKFHSPSH